MKLLLTVLLIYVGLLLLARLFERSLIFFPNYPGRLSGDWHPRGLPVEEVWLVASDGTKLHAWWIPAPQAQHTFIAFHGNAGNITHRDDVYRFLHELPANVLAVEYRGYGRSEGAPHEQGLYLDAQAAYDYLVRERGVPARRIIAFGQSLGTAIAADLALQREVGGVVLEAPFASGKALARRVYPFLPGLGSIVRTKFETGAKLARVSAPVLVVHCANDPVIAFPLGEEVFQLAREPKTFYRVEGYCHEEASTVAPQQYAERLRDFLKQIK